MHPAYFETRFRTPATVPSWPERFAIITAYAPTGQSWSDSENLSADLRLRIELGGVWHERITGYSPSTGHAESGWACELPLEDALDLGARFRQDAIYWVHFGELFVTHCDDRRALVRVGWFLERLDGATDPGGSSPGPAR